MKIFYCWSGERSRLIAEALKAALESLNEKLGLGAHFSGFISPEIPRGSVWFESVVKSLRSMDAGIVVMTPENLGSRWLHFESGALAIGLGAQQGVPRSIYTYLVEVTPEQLEGPLGQYQHTLASQADTIALTQQLLPENEQVQAGWKGVSESWWNELTKTFRGAPRTPPSRVIPDLDKLFQRKKFNEPTNQCTDNRWLDRYDAIAKTVATLSWSLPQVSLQCRPSARMLVVELQKALGLYAMAIRSNLVKELEFERDDNNLLKVPPGGLRECEQRRQEIVKLAACLTDETRWPVFEDAIAYESLGSHDERKERIHRRIAELESGYRNAKAGIERNALALVPDESELERARTSEWALDRILRYHMETLRSPDIGKGLDWAWQEWEKVYAKRGATSHMPLHYSLDVLETALAALDWQVPNERIDGLRELFECLLEEERNIEPSRIRSRLKNWDERLRSKSRAWKALPAIISMGSRAVAI